MKNKITPIFFTVFASISFAFGQQNARQTIASVSEETSATVFATAQNQATSAALGQGANPVGAAQQIGVNTAAGVGYGVTNSAATSAGNAVGGAITSIGGGGQVASATGDILGGGAGHVIGGAANGAIGGALTGTMDMNSIVSSAQNQALAYGTGVGINLAGAAMGSALNWAMPKITDLSTKAFGSIVNGAGSLMNSTGISKAWDSTGGKLFSGISNGATDAATDAAGNVAGQAVGNTAGQAVGNTAGQAVGAATGGANPTNAASSATRSLTATPSAPSLAMDQMVFVGYGYGNNAVLVGSVQGVKGAVEATIPLLENIDRNISNINEVNQAKQTLLAATNKMNELAQLGSVVMSDPFKMARANSLIRILKSPNAAIAPPSFVASLENLTPSLEQSGNGVLTNTQSSMGFTNFAQNGVPGNEVADMISKDEVWQQYMATSIAGAIAQDGMPAMMSMNIPVRLFSPTNLSLNRMLTNHLKTMPVGTRVEDINKFKVSDTVTIRRSTPADSQYFQMVQSGNSASKVAFYAAASYYNGFIYTPEDGYKEDGVFMMPYNMNDILTNGGFSMFSIFNPTADPKSNPYGKFASNLSGVILNNYGRMNRGTFIEVSSADLALLEKHKPIEINSGQFKPLANMPYNSKYEALSALKFQNNSMPRIFGEIRNVITNNAPNNDFVAVFSLPPRQMDSHVVGMQKHLNALSRIFTYVNITTLQISYNDDVLRSATELRNKLQAQAASSDEKSATGTLPALILHLDGIILATQNTMLDLTKRLHDYEQSWRSIEKEVEDLRNQSETVLERNHLNNMRDATVRGRNLNSP